MKPVQWPLALVARDVPANVPRSILPPPLNARLQGREKRKLGDRFGLSNFGVNLVCIEPGGMSSFQHAHARQDEFIYVVEGHPTLRTSEGTQRLAPGMCAGFAAGGGRAHHLLNETDAPVWYLEVGDRTPGDDVLYTEEDLKAGFSDGAWVFAHKDGTPY